MPPGMTYLPVASMVSSAVAPPPARSWPMLAIVSPSIRTSAAYEPSAVTIVPLVISVRIGPSWRNPRHPAADGVRREMVGDAEVRAGAEALDAPERDPRGWREFAATRTATVRPTAPMAMARAARPRLVRACDPRCTPMAVHVPERISRRRIGPCANLQVSLPRSRRSRSRAHRTIVRSIIAAGAAERQRDLWPMTLGGTSGRAVVSRPVPGTSRRPARPARPDRSDRPWRTGCARRAAIPRAGRGRPRVDRRHRDRRRGRASDTGWRRASDMASWPSSAATSIASTTGSLGWPTIVGPSSQKAAEPRRWWRGTYSGPAAPYADRHRPWPARTANRRCARAVSGWSLWPVKPRASRATRSG